MIQTDKILFIPSLRKGNGTGHLKRCLDWGETFKTMHIFIHQNNDEELLDYKNHPLCCRRDNIQWHEDPGTDWELVVLDNRSSDSLPDSLRGIAILALDESGKIRENASYVMDTLPALTKQMINSDGYRFLKRNYNPVCPDSLKRILISFGGEDPSDLAGRVLVALNTDIISSYIIKTGIKIDLIIPSESHKTPQIHADNIRVLPYVTELSEKLCDYDLIVCQYGLTAFEALSCSRFVFLLNPGYYHDQLSSAADIPYHPGAAALDPDQLSALMLNILKADTESMEFRHKKHSPLWKQYSQKSENFASWLCSLNISPDICPVCGSSSRKALARFEKKSYFQCMDCGMKYMVQFRIKEDIYSKEYFFSEYKNQYGKTYIEDFPHIQEMAGKRLKQIRKLNPIKGKLLDIGCAYGPFLQTASEKGYGAMGLEISEDAVKYIKDNFKNIDAQQGDLNLKETRDLFNDKEFQVITLWYVIEHFSNLIEILPYLASRLEKGGVLAMATPYASGVSGRYNTDHFYSISPEDHYTLWDRKSAVESLKRAGFSKIRFVSTGHHPERFSPQIKKMIPRQMLLLISRMMGWGDTFEIYAQKG